MKKIYLDWAATSYPKPPEVYRALDDFARKVGVGNDRGLYRESREVGSIITRARAGIAGLLGAQTEEIVFTSGATAALNTFLLGHLRPGDHIITSPFEHNSVRRPLKFLQEHRGVTVTTIPGSLGSGMDPGEIAKAIRPETRACVINHVSNAFGLVAPVVEVGRMLREYPEVVFALDAAQSLGTLPFRVDELGVDFLAFPGHKGLLGPPGTGGFYLRQDLVPDLMPLMFGGTGIRSGAGAYLEELPYKYEVGTQNSWGLAGLAAGVEYLRGKTVVAAHRHILSLTRRAVGLLSKIPGLTLYLPGSGTPHGLVSFRVAGLKPPDAASLLDELFSIKVREGLHCSPDAHATAGTLPEGTVRASFGIFTTEDEVERLGAGISEIVEGIRG